MFQRTGGVPRITRDLLILFAALALAACNDVGDETLGGDPWPDGDGDADSDADSDIDADTDGDADGDIDADADADGDAGYDEEIPPEDPEPPEEPPEEEPECNTEDEVVLYLSADDSNSMAGPVLARAMIRSGYRIWSAVRTYEFLNYYQFDYEAAEPGHLRVTAQMEANDDGETYNLQIGVRAPDQTAEDRRPVNLTLSLDTSGSMSGSPIDLVRESCLALAASLREGDVVSMVSWNTSQNILLESHHVDGPDDPELVAECRSLSANGGTDLHSGLVTAYRLARENFAPGRINRVILMSDGGANVGITDAELIAENADDAEGEAIYLMGAGMGDGPGYNDALMDTVTDAGKGAYVFIDSVDEAWRMFNERFLSNIEVAARDVQVELTLPPSFVMEMFHGEEYSEDPEEVEPQHLAPNDAMIFHQVLRSCDPSVLTDESPITVVATYQHPFTRTPRSDRFETTLGELLGAESPLLLKGNAIVAYAEALEATRFMEYGDPEALVIIDGAIAEVEAARAVFPDDPDLAEIAELLELYREQF